MAARRGEKNGRCELATSRNGGFLAADLPKRRSGDRRSLDYCLNESRFQRLSPCFARKSRRGELRLKAAPMALKRDMDGSPCHQEIIRETRIA